MIIELPDTTTGAISRELVRVRQEGGAVALGRVLTLVIATSHGAEEEAILAANDASREHPMRVIVLSKATEVTSERSRLDAQIRVGGDAGASEVVVLRAHGEAAKHEEGLVTGLLLADAPIVAWWPQFPPTTSSSSPIGRMAQLRITDAASQPDPQAFLHQLADSYSPGDTDFAWTRLTLWRAQLAATLDQPPYETVNLVEVAGAKDSPSTLLLAAWLKLQLGVEVKQTFVDSHSLGGGIFWVKLHRDSGVIELRRSQPGVVSLSQPGQPLQNISMPRRSLRDCLAEELRRLDPDEMYGQVLRKGLELVSGSLEQSRATQ
ncbi:MAG: glucose-6-phosphate dehydrogenase assembly protein OpcA [Cryobacterium sp.]|nr:glucose-6-phosphate dehydrogenase assembly protein OpcA [Cryobacterium sp.]